MTTTTRHGTRDPREPPTHRSTTRTLTRTHTQTQFVIGHLVLVAFISFSVAMLLLRSLASLKASVTVGVAAHLSLSAAIARVVATALGGLIALLYILVNVRTSWCACRAARSSSWMADDVTPICRLRPWLELLDCAKRSCTLPRGFTMRTCHPTTTMMMMLTLMMKMLLLTSTTRRARLRRSQRRSRRLYNHVLSVLYIIYIRRLASHGLSTRTQRSLGLGVRLVERCVLLVDHAAARKELLGVVVVASRQQELSVLLETQGVVGIGLERAQVHLTSAVELVRQLVRGKCPRAYVCTYVRVCVVPTSSAAVARSHLSRKRAYR